MVFAPSTHIRVMTRAFAVRCSPRPMSAESDAIYRPVRGVAFKPYSIDVVADMVELVILGSETTTL